MNILINELINKYTHEKYPISTGSEEWWDIKTEFEILGDAVVGAVAHEDYKKSIGFDKVKNYMVDLEKFKIRVDRYNPKDELETKEKKILQNKINIGQEIYKLILASIKKSNHGKKHQADLSGRSADSHGRNGKRQG